MYKVQRYTMVIYLQKTWGYTWKAFLFVKVELSGRQLGIIQYTNNKIAEVRVRELSCAGREEKGARI
jgi:hypothetical protein